MAGVADKARKARSICSRLAASGGADGVDALRRLYPGSRFYWTRPHGLMVFWSPASGRQPPRAILTAAGFVEMLPGGPVVKDRVGGSGSLARSMVEDIDVLEVMLS